MVPGDHGRDGIPYTYFQVGMPSDDYALAFPDQMLGRISAACTPITPLCPLVTYDYTSKGFQEHLRKVWSRLRSDGMRGIKFDYPETGWRPEGGFEDRHATTAAAYRKVFELATRDWGPTLLTNGTSAKMAGPVLMLPPGWSTPRRNWTDSNQFVPAMVTIGGLALV